MRRALLLSACGARASGVGVRARERHARRIPPSASALRSRRARSSCASTSRSTALPRRSSCSRATARTSRRAARAVPAKRAIVARLPKLPRGPYTVRWQAMSNDGHVVSGVYTFGVRVPAPLVTDAVGAQGPTRTEDLVRWAYFLALALLVGGSASGCSSSAARCRARRSALLLGRRVSAPSACWRSGIVAFLLRAEDALQLPFGRFLYGDLSPIAGGTRFGTAFIAMELGFAFVAALLFLAWLTDRRVLLWPVFVAGSLSRRASRSRATRRPTPGTPGSPSSPTGCT